MITDNKKLKLIFSIFSLLCIIAIGVCFICDFIITRRITWSSYVITSVIFAWVVISTLLISKTDRLIRTLIVLMLTVFPFLAILSNLTPATGWFVPLALPIGITTIIAFWLTYLLFRFIKINLWYISASLVVIYGIIANSVVRYFVHVFVDQSFLGFDYFINLFSCVVVAILLFIIGRYSDMNKKNENKDEQ